MKLFLDDSVESRILKMPEIKTTLMSYPDRLEGRKKKE